MTVSKRRGWEDGAIASLRRQTFQDFEWVIITEDRYTYKPFFIYEDLKVRHCFAPPKVSVSNLNASLNAGLRHCQGDYVIFYQDFIELDQDCFQKLYDLASRDQRTFVTTCTPNADGTDDTRYTGADIPRPCYPEQWEANVSIAPMKVLKELGGFDEDYDHGWSWDNVNLAERADMLNCNFIIDESNRPKLLFHVKEPDLNPTMRMNGDFHNARMEEIRRGLRPINCENLC